MTSQLERFPVELVAPCPEGALEPVLDEGDLMLQSPVISDLRLIYGAVISGGLLIMDIDESRVLAGVECGMEQSLWRRRGDPLPSPRMPRQGSLVVPQVAENEPFDDLVPGMWTDEAGTSVHVELEPVIAATDWIELSEHCWALVNDGFLAGFLARLLPAPGGDRPIT